MASAVGVACGLIGLAAILFGLGSVAYAALHRACQRGGWIWYWRERRRIRVQVARLRSPIHPAAIAPAPPAVAGTFDAITAQLGDLEDLAHVVDRFYEEA